MAQEVHPFGQQIRREDQRFAAGKRQNGTVVADPLEALIGERGEKLTYLFNESEFGHVFAVAVRQRYRFFGENDYLCLRNGFPGLHTPAFKADNR